MASQGRSMMGKLIGVVAFLAVAGAIVASISGGLADGSKANERVVLAPTMTVKLKDKPFKLEVAATNEARIKGMGGRTEIPPGTGMLFVFPRAQRLSFLMRDCPIPIDVLFIDATGRITAIHTMQPEEPRRPDEDDYAYDARLKKYSSRFPAQFAIEIEGGMAAKLGITEGEKVAIDTARLSKASELERVRIGSKDFYLELAASDPVRMMGLSGRVEIAEDSGMLFVFPDATERHFVMRDCPIPIDIIYLDASGKVLSFHEMLPEPPRAPSESPDAYENRLKPYPSNGPMQFAIELRGGTIRTLGLQPGATIGMDVERLKRLAR
ncbi:MAG: DUF192 domain-containing protein [Phycisphaeraceae bacterium]|nr:DUF192 domain-containing protein [Phycisphaeraceae bacterium]